jgi:hypothetical protein
MARSFRHELTDIRRVFAWDDDAPESSEPTAIRSGSVLGTSRRRNAFASWTKDEGGAVSTADQESGNEQLTRRTHVNLT